jgi:hypothetical protein
MNPMFFRGQLPRIYQTTIEETIEGPGPLLPRGWMQLTDNVSKRPVYLHVETNRVVFNKEDIFKKSPAKASCCEPEKKKRRKSSEPSVPVASQVASAPTPERPDRQPSMMNVVTPTSMSQPIDLSFLDDDDDEAKMSANNDEVDDEETVWDEREEQEEEDKNDEPGDLQLPIGMSELSGLTMTQGATQVPSQIETVTTSDDDDKTINSSKDGGHALV